MLRQYIGAWMDTHSVIIINAAIHLPLKGDADDIAYINANIKLPDNSSRSSMNVYFLLPVCRQITGPCFLLAEENVCRTQCQYNANLVPGYISNTTITNHLLL
jgi:hypothetical protein